MKRQSRYIVLLEQFRQYGFNVLILQASDSVATNRDKVLEFIDEKKQIVK